MNENSTKIYWKEKQKAAIENMNKRNTCSGILIEVAAQHPLKDGYIPNIEFQARLDAAIELYDKKKTEGFDVEIYVPGSIHLNFEGVPDKISLSAAGVNYLINHGIPPQIIHGDDLNQKYDELREHQGVYNSADECFVASKYFFEKDNYFRHCYSICSPNQSFRKMLLYIEQGVYPKIITVPTDNMFHDFVKELFDSLPYVVSDDHDYQSKYSKEAIRTRKERKPGYKNNL